MMLVVKIITALLLCSASVHAEDFRGRIVGISDGDTISVIHYGSAERVRTNGNDASEKCQAFGNKSKQFVSAMAFKKEVKVEIKGQDRYGRTIAYVILPDGRNLHHEVVKAGFAWWFGSMHQRTKS
jgi:micrococcal nuclease